MALQALLLLMTDHALLAVLLGRRGMKFLPVSRPVTSWLLAVAFLAELRRPGMALCAIYFLFFLTVHFQPVVSFMAARVGFFGVTTFALVGSLLAVMALKAPLHSRRVDASRILRVDQRIVAVGALHL